MKYKLTEETKEWRETIVHRIQALKDFNDVVEGDLGGWIEKEENLSQQGSCWVYDEARVCENARVYDNAKVLGDAWVFGNAKVYGDAKVHTNCWVYDDVRVGGNAEVCDGGVSGDDEYFGNNKEIYNPKVGNKSTNNKTMKELQKAEELVKQLEKVAGKQFNQIKKHPIRVAVMVAVFIWGFKRASNWISKGEK